MEKYDIALTSCSIGFIIGAILGIYVIYSSFNEVVIPSKLSELQSQFNLETQRTMPDEITLTNSLECIENKTIEYFAGFDNFETTCIHEKIMRCCGNDCYKYPFQTLIWSTPSDSFAKILILNETDTTNCFKIIISTINANNCLYLEQKLISPIQNRTYCIKAIEVIKR